MDELSYNINNEKNNRFLLLLIGLLFSRLGSNIYILALPLIAYDLTGSGLILGTVYAFEMLPFVILLPFGGVLIDRFNRRKLMILADIIRILLIILIPILFLFGLLTINHVFIIAFLLSSMSFFVDIPLITLIPTIVKKSDLTKRNAQIQLVENSSRIMGPLFAGLVIGLAGSHIALSINAITYLIMGICVFLIGSIPNQNDKKKKNTSVWTETKDGFKYILNRSDLSTIAVISFLCNMGMGIFMSTYIFYLRDILSITEMKIGIVVAFGGLFGILASLLTTKLEKKFNRGFLISFLLIVGGGMGTALITFIPHWLTTGIGFGLWGGSITMMSILLTTYKHENIETKIFGRVEGSLTSLSYLSLPLAGLIGGFLINSFNSLLTYLLAGLLVVSSGVITKFSPLRNM